MDGLVIGEYNAWNNKVWIWFAKKGECDLQKRQIWNAKEPASLHLESPILRGKPNLTLKT